MWTETRSMQQNKQKKFYQEQKIIHQDKLIIAKRKHRQFTAYRLVAFLLIAAGAYMIGMKVFLVAELLIGGALFLILVHKSLDAKIAKRTEELFIELIDKEINSLDGDWSGFESGLEYRTKNHPYSFDMDLFGEKSVFQLMNRTVLKSGSDLLARMLAFGSSKIELNQTMISEISKNEEWMHEFVVKSKVIVSEKGKNTSMDKIASLRIELGAIPVLRFILPVISLIAIMLYALNIIPIAGMILAFIFVLSIIGLYLKSTNTSFFTVLNKSDGIDAMVAQLELTKSLEVNSDEAKAFIGNLIAKNSALEGLKTLNLIRKRMEFRMNFLIGLTLNILLAWDFQVLIQLKNWHASNGKQLLKWEEELAQLEVWNSLAIYKFNHTYSTFAEFTSTNSFDIVELSHPFVAQEKQIPNDLSIAPNEHFLIITGPNMAGKSTYLRSVGLAIICANAGFPVLAKSCKMDKMELYSSMRTSDDLTVESSYFHAELTRLRFIMDAIESGKQVFVILDEILKGTNSKDKEIGSAKFLQKLKRLNSSGIIATHDLSLTNLAIENPAYRNVYFDSTISGENLSFDYKIRDGICQNMNASFLLKQMHLVD